MAEVGSLEWKIPVDSPISKMPNRHISFSCEQKLSYTSYLPASQKQEADIYTTIIETLPQNIQQLMNRNGNYSTQLSTAMKQQLPQHTNKDNPNLEILKAAAQAWLAHSSNPKSSTKEFDMRKGTSMRRPSRFQVEAIKLSKQREREAESGWDFSRSLWDPYEIVAVSKRLELGLLLDHAATPVPFVSRAEPGRTSKRGRKGGNGLRKLLRRSFRRRLNSG